MRGLIERIVLTPAEGTFKAELTGDLAAILAMCDAKNKHPGSLEPGCQVSVVAGACKQRESLIVPLEL